MKIPFSTHSRIPGILLILLVSVVYYLLAMLGLGFTFQSFDASPFWLSSGFALAAFLLLGKRIAAGIWLGAFAANLFAFLSNGITDTITAIWSSAVIGIGNTLEAFLGFYLLRYLPRVENHNYFRKVNHVLRFLSTIILISLVGSSIGSAVNFLARIIEAGDFFISWLTWWTGDIAGILLLTPLLLVWTTKERLTYLNRKKIIEVILLFTGVIFISGVVFQFWFFTPFLFTRSFLIAPLLIWAAVRFRQRIFVMAVLFSGLISIYGTIQGHGPFIAESFNESLLTVQTFVSINCGMALLLNAAIFERQQTELFLRNTRNNLERLVNERTAELLASNRQLAEAQRLAHIGSWEWDVKKNLITWSDELYRVYGLSPQTFNPDFERFMECIHPEDRQYINDQIQRSFNDHQPFNFYHRIIRPDGVIRTVHGQGEVFTDDAGNLVKMAGTGQDVTETKIAEEMLLQTSKELEQKNRDLERSNTELASFSYAASHDLQEPLRKIQTFCERILFTEYDSLSEQGKEFFNKIQASAARMKTLIVDILSYSQVNTIDESFVETDLKEILQQVKHELTDSIQQKQAVIESSDLPRLKVIPFQITQLFTNIIGNALKFSKPDVSLHIVIRSEIISGQEIEGADANQSYHCISISDNGIGFSQEYSKKIFKIFQRLHNRSNYEGTGIGLAICKKVAENHNGFISAEGVPGKGSTFNVYLPV